MLQEEPGGKGRWSIGVRLEIRRCRWLIEELVKLVRRDICDVIQSTMCLLVFGKSSSQIGCQLGVDVRVVTARVNLPNLIRLWTTDGR
jgi:hypothetical protein